MIMVKTDKKLVSASLSRRPRHGITASIRPAPKLAAVPGLPPAGSGLTVCR
jgi:hypothetical protein